MPRSGQKLVDERDRLRCYAILVSDRQLGEWRSCCGRQGIQMGDWIRCFMDWAVKYGYTDPRQVRRV